MSGEGEDVFLIDTCIYVYIDICLLLLLLWEEHTSLHRHVYVSDDVMVEKVKSPQKKQFHKKWAIYLHLLS